ncbi:RING finger domain-containing protein [Arthroderma uncinatum]|uniref:RING finger domain-containing protein n=1 Tax=Arthroderma uncinatum TaxID=74035 RepID=UPI00144A5598|nr:RING finger domain-containing protein [Arthroderma uncinatum]KAF3482719.1 RING finger domain-containing protein [Arthroderma uncinatum]
MDRAPSWEWPEAAAHPRAEAAAATAAADTENEPEEANGQPAGGTKNYPNRTCRICLESVPPTTHLPSDSFPSFLQAKVRVTYDSQDPELGRLLRPCKCKGSSRYVHEGCLRLWRNADPAYGRRNYWQCPTCGFEYRLERMTWARWINSRAAQMTLTIGVLFLAMFLLGFVADPIINLYLDPLDTITGELWDDDTGSYPVGDGKSTWTEHLLKGLASLGVLSFIKVMLALSPWQWWNLRNSGLLGGSNRRTANSGRSRAASVSWIVLAIGVATFLWGVYKGVRAWSCRILETAGQRVMDVPLDDDDEDDDGGGEEAASSTDHAQSKKND